MKKALVLVIFFVSYTQCMQNSGKQKRLQESEWESLCKKFSAFQDTIQGKGQEYDTIIADSLKEFNDPKGTTQSVLLNQQSSNIIAKRCSFSCDSCSKLLLYHHIAPHKRWHKDSGEYKCDTCQLSFDKKSTLSHHLNTVFHKDQSVHEKN